MSDSRYTYLVLRKRKVYFPFSKEKMNNQKQIVGHRLGLQNDDNASTQRSHNVVTARSMNPNNIHTAVSNLTISQDEDIRETLIEMQQKLEQKDNEMREMRRTMMHLQAQLVNREPEPTSSTSNYSVPNNVNAYFDNYGHNHKSNIQSMPKDVGRDEFMMLMRAVIQTSEGTQFAQLQTSLQKLSGTEGRSKVKAYFDSFEAVTVGWSSERRAILLSTKLVGQARVIFDGLPDCYQHDYFRIKSAISQNNTSIGYLRVSAQNQLLAGLTPNSNENLREFGMRVLGIVRDSLKAETPESSVEDLAVSIFLKGIKDRTIYTSIALLRDSVNYYELIDKAASLQNADKVYQSTHFRRWNTNDTQTNPTQLSDHNKNHNTSKNYNGKNFGSNENRKFPNKTGGNSQPIQSQKHGHSNMIQSIPKSKFFFSIIP